MVGTITQQKCKLFTGFLAFYVTGYVCYVGVDRQIFFCVGTTEQNSISLYIIKYSDSMLNSIISCIVFEILLRSYCTFTQKVKF